MSTDEQDRDQRVEAYYQESTRWLAERLVDLEDEVGRLREETLRPAAGPDIHGLRRAARRYHRRAEFAKHTINRLRAERTEDEETIDQLRADLVAATRFEVGPAAVSLQWDGAWRLSWPDPQAPPTADPHPLTEDHPDRDTALTRARRIAQETQ